jgi:hypothetical protein
MEPSHSLGVDNFSLHAPLSLFSFFFPVPVCDEQKKEEKEEEADLGGGMDM